MYKKVSIFLLICLLISGCSLISLSEKKDKKEKIDEANSSDEKYENNDFENSLHQVVSQFVYIVKYIDTNEAEEKIELDKLPSNQDMTSIDIARKKIHESILLHEEYLFSQKKILYNDLTLDASKEIELTMNEFIQERLNLLKEIEVDINKKTTYTKEDSAHYKEKIRMYDKSLLEVNHIYERNLEQILKDLGVDNSYRDYIVKEYRLRIN